jgi:uncharacterized protein (TIGR03083 family)
MSKPQHTKAFWLDALRVEGDAFRVAVSDEAVAPDAPVPSCPGWTVTDLVRHLAGVYGRVRRHIDRRSIEPIEPWEAPLEGDAFAVWTDEYSELLATLDAVDPDLPSWNWAPQAKKAIFWPRRMAHETAVHRWDAQMAAGLAEPIEATLASDGVTEVLDTWLPSGRRRMPAERTGVVALHATDVDQVWFVRLRGSGVALLDSDTLLDSDDHHERATASGSASDLVLALFGRIPFDTLLVTGEVSLLECLCVG